VAERNIKEGGYQPISDPPPPPNDPVPPEAVNPITGNPNHQPSAPGGTPSPPANDAN
jgi:hypothetical protein